MYIISRIATNNPSINGQKLYLSDLGLWSLNVEDAFEFNDELTALRYIWVHYRRFIRDAVIEGCADVRSWV